MVCSDLATLLCVFVRCSAVVLMVEADSRVFFDSELLLSSVFPSDSCVVAFTTVSTVPFAFASRLVLMLAASGKKCIGSRCILPGIRLSG